MTKPEWLTYGQRSMTNDYDTEIQFEIRPTFMIFTANSYNVRKFEHDHSYKHRMKFNFEDLEKIRFRL